MRRRTLLGILGSAALIGGASVAYFSQSRPSRQTVYLHEGLQIVLDTNTEYGGKNVANLVSIYPAGELDRLPNWKVIGMDYNGDGKIDKTITVRGTPPVTAFQNDWLTTSLARAREYESLRQDALRTSMPGKVPSAR
jgi:hypothetical protein